jgi:CRP-like cAMP-binding protein
LSLTALERLAEALVPRQVSAGETVIREGEPGRDYFLVERGEVEVRMGDRPINRGGPGDGFGEIALVRAVPRTATVVALTDLSLEVLDSADFIAAIAGPSSAAAVTTLIDERLARSASAG